MSYQAIARKYRPETFADVVGQTHVTGTLRAALRKDRLSHAYLFAGPRGCGKTTVARLLAKALNCAENREGDPCGRCETCRAIARGSYLDVLEIDAASNTGVDNIRELRDMAQYAPGEGSSRIFIIDEVHMLSKGAFNALLKILEEPPARVYFFFATTEPNKIPRTILSRCQRFDFRLLGREELGARLEYVAQTEGVALDPAARRLLVSLAEGSVRDGLSLLDQVMAGAVDAVDEQAVIDAFGLVRAEAYVELNEAMIARDAGRALRLVDELAAAGQSLDEFARGVVTNFRNLLLLKLDPKLAGMVELAPEQVEQLTGQAAHFGEQDLLALIDLAGRHFEHIYRSTQPRIMLEASVVAYCHFESRVLLADLARRLEALGTGRSTPGGGTNAGGRAPAPPTAARDANPDLQAGATRVATPQAPSASASVSGDQDWIRLIDNLMKTKPRVGACLMQGRPELAGDRLRVVFAADKRFQVDSLAGESVAIESMARETWGRPVRVELVLGDKGQSVHRQEQIRHEVAPTHREELDEACRGDTALGGLVDLMGGSPLSESEREEWDGKAH